MLVSLLPVYQTIAHMQTLQANCQSSCQWHLYFFISRIQCSWKALVLSLTQIIWESSTFQSDSTMIFSKVLHLAIEFSHCQRITPHNAGLVVKSVSLWWHYLINKRPHATWPLKLRALPCTGQSYFTALWREVKNVVLNPVNLTTISANSTMLAPVLEPYER